MATLPTQITQTWLERFLATHGGVAGTVHQREDDALTMVASVNIPPPVQAATKTIPKGKGMAGLAWERAEPVSTCNLKTDQTGDVRPGAKAVDAAAAVALPLVIEGDVVAVVGIAYAEERSLTSEDFSTLMASVDELPLTATQDGEQTQ